MTVYAFTAMSGPGVLPGADGYFEDMARLPALLL